MSQIYKLPVQAGSKINVWRPDYNNAIDALLTSNRGTLDPATTGDAYAVDGSVWDDETAGEFKHRDGAAWFTVFKTGVNYGGLLLRDGSLPLEGNLDADGYDVILDQDGDTRLKNDRDAGVADDEVILYLGGAVAANVLHIGKIVATKPLFDMLGVLRLARPEGVAIGTPSGVYGSFPIDIDGAGTLKYVELMNAP